MKSEELIALLEERQDDETFRAAKAALEDELRAGEDGRLLLAYGYVHEARAHGLLREAIRCYARSLELDAACEKTRHQLIAAHTALRETQEVIDLFKRRLEEAPGDIVEYRSLAHAYVAAGETEAAAAVIAAGLELAPDDAFLLDQRATVLAARGLVDEALEVWQRAVDVDAEYVDARYSRAFLLERVGRVAEAAAEWEQILAWLAERGYTTQTEWPRRELARLRGRP